MTDIFLILMLICMLGGFIFIGSGLLNFIKGNPSKEEWKRALIFYILAAAFFILFGLSL